jgi:hypothetical protein
VCPWSVGGVLIISGGGDYGGVVGKPSHPKP